MLQCTVTLTFTLHTAVNCAWCLRTHRLKIILARVKAVIKAKKAITDNSCNEIKNVRLHWCTAGNGHGGSTSIVCNYAVLPRELMPRLGNRSALAPQVFPYFSQATIDDVFAMREVRRQAVTHERGVQAQANWSLLAARLQQYAATGEGTVAEAIFCNDLQWRGHVPHELKPLRAV
jgi:hypothetical protein